MAELELVGGVADVARDEWNALVGSESPFLEWDFLAALEQSGAVGGRSGWTPRSAARTASRWSTPPLAMTASWWSRAS